MQFNNISRALILFIFAILHSTSSLNLLSSAKRIMGATLSTSQWYFYGRKNFTKTGYEKHIKAYKEPVQTSADIKKGAEGNDGVTMEGKVVVITGANSGIGKEMATYAAAKGATLYMLCRSQGRAEEAKADIQQKNRQSQCPYFIGGCHGTIANKKGGSRVAIKGRQGGLHCVQCRCLAE